MSLRRLRALRERRGTEGIRTDIAALFALAPLPLRIDDFHMRTLICTILVVTSAVFAKAQSVPSSRDADTALIRREIEIICQAFVDKDRKVLEETHGKEWRGFTPGNDHVIRGIDGYMREATFGPNAQKGQGMVGYKLSDFDVVFYGDTAVASFVLESDVVNGGQKRQQKLTILDVFHKEARGWTQVASNTSLHGDEMMRQMSAFRGIGDDEKKELFAAREAVWRAWFSGQTAALTNALPPELVTIEPDGTFGTLKSNLDGSRAFAAGGGKLIRLAFPKTEVQAYGATVILYTTYEMVLMSDGKETTQKGAATEVFVRQPDGRWVNTGWQLAPASR
jgi:ketosteroid isomerase-like protein